MNIKTYGMHINVDRENHCSCCIAECPDGKFVKIEDLDTIVSELYLKHAPEQLKEHIKRVKEFNEKRSTTGERKPSIQENS